MKRKLGQLFMIMGILLALQFPTTANGSQVRSVETEGTIGFTGVYEPIGTPDPKPPEHIVKPPAPTKPGGSLPQTNSETTVWLLWLGLLLVSVVVYLKRRNKQQHTNENKKESRSIL